MDNKTVVKGGIYRHFKGNLYHVIGTALNSETTETMVVYRALYGEHNVWVRPLSMFTETMLRDGKETERFMFTGTVSEEGTID